MLTQLEGHIQQSQLDTLKGIITTQYARYRQLMNSPEFTTVFREEYNRHKHQHSVSWAISSAFPSNTTVAESLRVSCLQYGRGHTRPELQNDNIVIHILNHTSHFGATYLKEYYALNRFAENPEKLYCYLKFWVESKQLKKVVLCVPNENGDIIASEELLNVEALKLVA